MPEVWQALLLLAAGYAAFSWKTYADLQPAYQRARLCAAARPDGSEEDAMEAVKELKSLGCELAADVEGGGAWLPWPGTGRGLEEAGELLYADQELRVLRAGGGEICICTRAPPAEWAAQLPALLDAVCGRSGAVRVVEDVASRCLWQEVLLQTGGALGAADVAGEWEYRYRDYVNAEELGAMAATRGAFSPLRLRGGTRLQVAPDGEGSAAVLRDTFDLLGLVPLQIEWRGRLRPCPDKPGRMELKWEDTSAEVGWRPFLLRLERPSAAERLRQEPWEVRAALPGGAGGAGRVLALYRRGVGSLAFQRLGR